MRARLREREEARRAAQEQRRRERERESREEETAGHFSREFSAKKFGTPPCHMRHYSDFSLTCFRCGGACLTLPPPPPPAIEALLSSTADQPQDGLSALFDKMASECQALQKFVSDSSLFLASYDLRNSQQVRPPSPPSLPPSPPLPPSLPPSLSPASNNCLLLCFYSNLVSYFRWCVGGRMSCSPSLALPSSLEERRPHSHRHRHRQPPLAVTV